MANLCLTFSDVYNLVSEYLGFGSTPTGTNLTKVKNIVHRGYRQFLNPVDGRTGRGYIWSFLKKESMLVTKEGVSEYELPSDFGCLWYGPKYDNDMHYPNPQPTSIETVRVWLSTDTSNNYPQLYSIVSDVYNPLIGQKYKIVFYPSPNSNYLLRYGYITEPPKLSNDTDIFAGGTRTSEAILETCLAVAEQQEDDIIGLHTQLSAKLINDLIRADVRQVPDSLGIMGSGNLVDKYTAARLLRYYPDPVEVYGES